MLYNSKYILKLKVPIEEFQYYAPEWRSLDFLAFFRI